jgi:hypothetical protein
MKLAASRGLLRVMAGLDPAIHDVERAGRTSQSAGTKSIEVSLSRRWLDSPTAELRNRVDGRVKPGHDGFGAHCEAMTLRLEVNP